MATIKNNWLRAGIAFIVLLFGFFIVVKAMEKGDVKADTEKASATTTYFYNGPSSNLNSDIMEPSFWGPSQSSSFTCGHSTNIPCSLEVPDGQDVEQHLQELGSLSAIQAATETRRNP